MAVLLVILSQALTNLIFLLLLLSQAINNITNKNQVKRNELNFSTITSIETRTINIVLKHKIILIINYS